MYYTRHIILAPLFRRKGNDNLRCAGKTRVLGKKGFGTGAPEAPREKEKNGRKEKKKIKMQVLDGRRIRLPLSNVRMRDFYVCGAIKTAVR